MKKTVFFIALLSFAIYFSSCKKCYTCHNTCMKCVLTAGTVVTHTLCTDSFANVAAYNAAVSNDSANGFICTSTGSTYSYDFCVNKPGDKEHYINYFNEGGRAICTAK